MRGNAVGRNKAKPHCAETRVKRCNALPLIAPYSLSRGTPAC
jgi:hypothetical protein